MHKDVIYIDTEDDITAIIGKIKASNEKIVALVPPKRIGVLQSAVNLRLLARMTENSNKHLVIVTNNKALIALSATVMIPVAKNLQSKPEIAEVESVEVDENEDIIEGSQLPIGELSKTAEKTADEQVVEAIDTIDIDGDAIKDNSIKSDKNLSNKKVKVPNFITFRKKLFLGIFLAIALGCFLVWAIIYAPSAKIIITAQTSPAPVSKTVTLGGATTATDVSKSIIQTVSKQIIKDVSVTFTATGKKTIGTAKATGVVTVKNCDSQSAFSIEAGTVFTASTDQTFTSNVKTSVPGFTGSASLCRSTGAGAGTVDIAVTAANAGTDYNISATGYTIAGISGDIYVTGSDMAGGTSKTTTVVSADDILKAKQALADLSNDTVKKQLIAEFTNGEYVISDSFKVVHADAVSLPALDVEALSAAKLTSSTTFSVTAVAKSEVETYLKSEVTKQLASNDSQRIYDDGIDGAVLAGYSSTDLGTTVNITSKTGKIGPNIDKDAIESQAKGKRYGEVQSQISEIEGVNNVDIVFPYFWVTTVPNDLSKVTVEFILENE